MNDKCLKCGKEINWNTKYTPMTATCSCGAQYRKKDGAKVFYRQMPNQGFVCSACGSEIQTTTVYHPIHDGPFPLSGSGRVQRQIVPYCPKCETKPSESGWPITQEFDF